MDKNLGLAKYAALIILGILALTALYIVVPPSLGVRDYLVWLLFALIILLIAIPGIYLINRYKKEDKGRLQRMLENVTAGIVGAILVTLLDRISDYQLPPDLSLGSLFQFFVGIFYVLAFFISFLGILLLPVWVILSYIDRS